MTIRKGGGPGDDERFESVYRQYYGRVWRNYRRNGIADDEAHDLAQDAFQRLYERMDQIRGPDAWPFLKAIAHTVLLNRIRSRNTGKRNAKMVAIDDPDVHADLPKTDAPDHGEQQQTARRRASLYRELKTLSEGQQQVLLLQLAGKSYDEIAGALHYGRREVAAPRRAAAAQGANEGRAGRLRVARRRSGGRIMITKSDWQAVHARLLAERRETLGDPPTVEEMLAYSRGELSRDDEERVRALLVSYPELLRALTVEFTDDDAQPGDPDYLPEPVVARQWDAFQGRIRGRQRSDGGRVLQFWRASAAVAAALAIAFGALLWRAQSQLDRPRVLSWQEQVLQPEGRQRGGGEVVKTFSPNAELLLLAVSLLNEQEFPLYRLEIASAADPSRPIWRNSGAKPQDAAFTVAIPRKFLASGTYRLTVYGINGAREEQLDTYAFRVR
jgi:RNA polymerase sigma factor (sigma-70 family)